MDLVSNFVGSISSNIFGENKQVTQPNIDLGDKTFADMLEEQMNKEIDKNKPNFIDSLGIPSGVYIGDLDGMNPVFDTQTNNSLNSVKPVNEFENTASSNYKDIKDMSTSEVLTFFHSIFDTKPTMTDTSNSGLFEFERKTAANYYSKYSKNIVTDLGEFVTDALRKA